jgi:CDP-diacylglycerol--glycerol-3-phosphate 3-phosphatidyltransferase
MATQRTRPADSVVPADAPARRPAFGPSALVTPANAVTLARVAATPLLMAVIAAGGASWPATGAWVAVTLTDGLDGFIARRHGTTRSGAFLDPLADKVLVLGAMVTLVVTGAFWWLPVALIAAREVAVSAYRAVAGRRGVSVPARPSAKAKTFVQDVAVGLALMPPAASRRWLAGGALWAAVALTLLSGLQYLWDARRRAATGGARAL